MYAPTRWGKGRSSCEDKCDTFFWYSIWSFTIGQKRQHRTHNPASSSRVLRENASDSWSWQTARHSFERVIQPSYFRNEVTVAATSQSNNYICLDAESRRQEKTDGKTSRELQHGNFHARHWNCEFMATTAGTAALRIDRLLFITCSQSDWVKLQSCDHECFIRAYNRIQVWVVWRLCCTDLFSASVQFDTVLFTMLHLSHSSQRLRLTH